MSLTIDRESPRHPPPGKPVGAQRWHRLLFSHWEVPLAQLRPMVHPALELDTFDGKAYVGVVAFTMMDVRPAGYLPEIPLAKAFFEINVRTYVHHQGDPGVWFFSLDANHWPASIAARAMFHLPYWYAKIEGHDDGHRGSWQVTREKPTPARWNASFEIGEALGEAAPGSLEFWLAERYRLFVSHNGTLLRGRIHHHPYPLRRAKADCTGGLLEAAGIDARGARTPDYFSEGVDAKLWLPEKL